MAHATTHQLSNAMRECIDECQACHSICLQTVHHCLELGGEHAASHHITTLLSCAAICQTSADVMLLGSEQHVRTCSACADICRACEEECRRMSDDDMMRQCADECRRCAESCARMARAA